ncbi:hypothetical protein Peur_033182 [Populus x canadensis]
MFEAINNAITVAAKGHPEGFKLKRGEIVQTVYSSLFSLHCRHDHNELTRPDKAKRESFKDEAQNGGVKNMKTVQERKYSYSEAEAFVEKIDEEKGKKQRLQGPVSKLAILTNASYSNNEHDSMRPQGQGLNKMIKNKPDVFRNKDKITMPGSSSTDRREHRFRDEAAMQDKFEAAKKKLQIGYQQAEKGPYTFHFFFF